MKEKAITISIIGHRDLLAEHYDIIKNRIEVILQNVKDQHPNTSLRFMSPLAEGSDQLGADVAVSMGFQLIVPLPMEPKEYLKNFDENSKQIFDNLLIQAHEHCVLRCNKCLSKEDHYLNLGKYLIQNSNILLVLWDGQFSDKIGGTGYLMNQIYEIKQTSSLLRKIIHLRIPRKSNPFTENSFQIEEIDIIFQ